MSTIWTKTNTDRKRLSEDIAVLLNAAGADDWLGMPEAPVLLKPNLVVGKPASSGATTTPEIVAGLIEWLLEKGFKNLAISEGSWVGDSTARAFKTCGYTALSKHYNIPLIDLQKDDSVEVETPAGTFEICRTIADLEFNGGSLINMPLVKGHGQTHMTCALKNMKGCIPDSEKRRYHRLGVHKPVAVVNTIIKPAFALVDGLNPDPYWEEGGSPEKRDLLLVGRDPVAMDSYACKLLGMTDEDVQYVGLAEQLGIGTGHISDEDIINLDGAAVEASAARQEKSEVKEWIDNLVDQQSACSSCFGNLASALRALQEEYPDFIKTSSPGLCIGQDFQGVKLPGDKRGIGICTVTGSNQSLKGCPPSRDRMIEYLKKEYSL